MNFLYIGMSLYASDTSSMWFAYLHEMIMNTSSCLLLLRPLKPLIVVH